MNKLWLLIGHYRLAYFAAGIQLPLAMDYFKHGQWGAGIFSMCLMALLLALGTKNEINNAPTRTDDDRA